jgi:outer membrane protein OmpA-like peptidoglycan-associated protein
MRIIFSIVFLVLLSFEAFTQAKTRRLPSIINHPSLNVYAPFISADGNALLFISNNGQDGALVLSYTSRETDWSEPVEIPKELNTRLYFLRGYSLSADGKRMYFTCAKSPVVGGYDIFTSDLKGSSWSTPQNLTVPINSKTNEGCPSISADGSALYFMRCDKMDQNKADGCKIFVARKKSNGQWDEPQELPPSINAGNSQTPRIMADGETLIFSSNTLAPSKGGMDLYLTRFQNGAWSNPTALDFVNTEKDDQYVSVAALGRYLLKESVGARKNIEITEFLIPEELRPRGMMKVEGKILNPSGAPVPAYVSVEDLKSHKRIYSGRPANDGSYFLYVPEGSKYELSIDPEQSSLTFFSKNLDLTSDKIPQKEKVNVTLKQPASRDEIDLNLIEFKPYSSTLQPSSESELKKMVRLAKANAGAKFEVQVLWNGYLEDSVQSNPDLTETIADSLHTQVQIVDNGGQEISRDTTLVRVTYHNDRTIQQAKAIVAYLVSQGLDEARFSVFGNAIAAPPSEPRKLVVKVMVK